MPASASGAVVEVVEELEPDWAPLVVGAPSMAPKAAPPVRVAANATAAAARLVVRCIELSWIVEVR